MISAGYDVSFVVRDSSRSLADHTWILRHGRDESKWSAPLRKNIAEEVATRRQRLIVVATRTNDLASVWTTHLSRLPVSESPEEKTVIFVCCNGWAADTIMQWAKARPDLMFRLAITTAGIAQTGDSLFVRSDETGKIWWGPIHAAYGSKIRYPAESALPPVFEWDAQIMERARRKWLFNTAANTLAGVYQLARNQLLLEQHRNQLRELFDEAHDLGCEMWPEWQRDNNRNPGRREVLWRDLCALIRATGANENSMSRAAKTGKGTAEAMYLGGLAFGHTGYPELKKATRKLLHGKAVTR